jgi:hypothetical protein
MSCNSRRSLILVLISFLVCVSGIGQERKGTIIGHVTDVKHGVLQGARVQVQPTGQVAATDSQGQFTIAGLPPVSTP